jgi:hypothetical protein
MTRKDDVAIAAALKACRISNVTENPNRAIYLNGLDNAANAVANVLGGDNPRFDRQRFLTACGVAQ